MVAAIHSQKEMEQLTKRIELLESCLDAFASAGHAADKADCIYYLQIIYFDLMGWERPDGEFDQLVAWHAKGVAQSYLGLWGAGLISYDQIKGPLWSRLRSSLEMSYSRLLKYKDSLSHFLQQIEELQSL